MSEGNAAATNEVSSIWGQVAIGVLGGFAALLVRYLSQHHGTVVGTIRQTSLPLSALQPVALEYLLLAPILLVLGGIVAFIANERNRTKLFALGISAPALITTAAGDKIKLADITLSLPFSSAFAQPAPNQTAASRELNELFTSGENRIYTVQLAAFQSREAADSLTARVNRLQTVYAITSPTVRDGQTYYRVWVTQALSLKDALLLKERLMNPRVGRELGFSVPADTDIRDVTREWK